MSLRLLAALLVAGAGCGPDVPDGPAVLPRDPSKPYVITAIDYHFHDAHPTPPLAPEREVVVSNQGRNIHNVTIPGTEVVRDLQPGDRVSLGTVAELLGAPGRHRFVCRYHIDRGMAGVIVVAA